MDFTVLSGSPNTDISGGLLSGFTIASESVESSVAGGIACPDYAGRGSTGAQVSGDRRQTLHPRLRRDDGFTVPQLGFA